MRGKSIFIYQSYFCSCMKLLLFTDIHGSNKAIKELKKKIQKYAPDLICCTGDISIADRNTKEMLGKLNTLGKEVILIHGNHEDENELEKACRGFSNIFYLHKRTIVKGNILFMGFGGDGFSHVDKEFVQQGKKFLDVMKKNKSMKTVLMTHGPPYKNNTDEIMENYCGNKSYREFIIKAKPDLAVCGHLHENFGRTDFIGKTFVINPGPLGVIVEI